MCFHDLFHQQKQSAPVPTSAQMPTPDTTMNTTFNPTPLHLYDLLKPLLTAST
jgi:hypothetical protein